MDDELRFVEALEREIGRLRKRAAKSALAPVGKDAPIVLSRRECKWLRRAAAVLDLSGPEALIRASVLAEAKRAIASCNATEEDEE